MIEKLLGILIFGIFIELALLYFYYLNKLMKGEEFGE